uniref:Uncharacterized protein n=1 Tax=Zooxanthella nutricula TaxID=1333877 RepID=A0A7S2IT17_9DINO
MDLFLRETGIGFVTRSALAAAGYGVGSMQNTITHTGDVLEIITKCLGRTHSVKFVADGAEHDAKDPVDGRPVKFLASWEEDGHSMRVTGHWAQSGKAVPEMRRFMEGGEMHVQQTASTGRAVTRVFRRA